jgi:hypothetical protein
MPNLSVDSISRHVNIHVVANNEYKSIVVQLQWRQVRLEEERAALEVRRSEIDNERARVDGALARLMPLSGEICDPSQVTGMGFTDAIRHVMKYSSGRWMSPAEIRNDLAEKGFKVSGYTNPMASIYTILIRLTDMEELERSTENNKVLYRATEKLMMPKRSQ